jgi:two-component system, sensor histidine kinase ChiS
MKQLFNNIFSNSDDRSQEQKVFIYLSATGIIAPLILTVINIFTKLYFQAVVTLLIVTFCSIAYYYARFKKRYFFVVTIVSIQLANYLAYFNALGINGPIPFFFMIIYVFAILYSPPKWRFKTFIILTSGLAILLVVEYMFPELVNNPFKTQQALHNYLVAGFIFSVILSFGSIYFMRVSYDNEKEKNLKQQVLLKRLNYQKSMFFINLSHEIKTPLTLVENYLEKYIKLKGEDEELIIMRRNIQKMRRDILEYLNLENLERGQVSYDKMETLLLSKFLAEKLDFFVAYAENKDIALCSDIHSGIYVNVNLQGIDQVTNNLLENAVKYTPKSQKIYINLKKEGNHAKLIIQNSGTEIPANQIQHLFEPFYQLSHEKLNAQGIGMGLYIVKKILESTNGQIQVTSSKELGVVFTVLLQLSSERTIVAAPTNTPPVLSTPTPATKAVDSSYLTNRPSILVVEDNNDFLRFLAEQLADSYNIYVACNGVVAIEKLENMPLPELIVSDIMMDKMNGYELLDQTINDERFAHIPFIFITAKDELKEKATSLNKGALDFITKPFMMDELKMKIKAIIDQKKRISAAAIRDMKKEFNGDYHLGSKQRQDDLFNTNALNYNLTDREKEIVLHMKEGMDYEKIAEVLHISKHTVNRHVQNIYEKTCANSKTALFNRLF